MRKDQTKHKKKIQWGTVLQMGIGAIAGAGLGLLGLFNTDSPLELVVLLAALMVSCYAHIILHEGGHLVCGLLTGYRFLSFRIGKRMLMRQDGKLMWRKYHIPGTGGQCLLEPPEGDEYSYLLYNLGGGLSNLLFAGLAFFAMGFATGMLQSALLVFVLVGITLGLTNLIPMKVGGVSNDGYNIRCLGQGGIVPKAFALQLRVVARQMDGLSLKDMPEEWFSMTDGMELNDPLVAAVATLAASRLLDQGKMEQGEQAIHTLLNQETGMAGVHKMELTCEEIFCMQLRGAPAADYEGLETKALTQYRKGTRSYMPARLRQDYAKALLVDNDETAAAGILAQFEKQAPRYPYQVELAGERRMMDLVRERKKNLGL